MSEAAKSAYLHGEAFCLMWYGCECGHRERIWNSRDGVTPFGLLCPSCGGTSLRHIEWRRDERAPNHKPAVGQRYFADGTPAEAETIIKRRIENFAKAGHSVPPDVQESLLSDARHTTGEWMKGWPSIQRSAE